jgi:hypothetical protein
MNLSPAASSQFVASAALARQRLDARGLAWPIYGQWFTFTFHAP